MTRRRSLRRILRRSLQAGTALSVSLALQTGCSAPGVAEEEYTASDVASSGPDSSLPDLAADTAATIEVVDTAEPPAPDTAMTQDVEVDTGTIPDTAADIEDVAAADLLADGDAAEVTDAPGDPLAALLEQCPDLAEPSEDLGIAALLTELGADYVAIHRGEYWGPFSEPPGSPRHLFVGTECETATDPVACSDEIALLAASSPNRFVLYTSGDDVQRLHSYQFLEAIGLDTVDKAALYLWMRAGYEGKLIGIAAAPTGGYKAVYSRWSDCPYGETAFLVHLDAEGNETVIDQAIIWENGVCAGRLPAGLELSSTPASTGQSGDHVAAFFAQTAYLEAAAVIAFDNLAAELEAFDAPEELTAAARRAADDERMHTELMLRLVRRSGVEAMLPPPVPVPQRTLVDFAIDNAVEGCVRETYAALLGSFQGERSSDPEIAAAMRTIGADETRHAELSWAMADWLEERLTGEEWVQVEHARRDAVVHLRRSAESLAERMSPAEARTLGLPNRAESVAMLDVLEHELWV